MSKGYRIAVLFVVVLAAAAALLWGRGGGGGDEAQPILVQTEQAGGQESEPADRTSAGPEAGEALVSDAGPMVDEPAESSLSDVAAKAAETSGGIPRLVDLGSKKCIPCKKMAPILEELKREYAGRMEVVFIDVRENRQAASDYGIRLIPTQIFYDSEGRELFRHEGFYGKEAILGKWRELGVEIGAAASTNGVTG